MEGPINTLNQEEDDVVEDDREMNSIISPQTKKSHREELHDSLNYLVSGIHVTVRS